jgi:hypothetical protein
MKSLDRPRETDTERVTDQDGAVLLEGLAGRLRDDGLTAETEDDRLRVTARPGGRAVMVEVRRRSDNSGRWWFTWGGQVWLCAAEDIEAALMEVKRALRQVGR